MCRKTIAVQSVRLRVSNKQYYASQLHHYTFYLSLVLPTFDVYIQAHACMEQQVVLLFVQRENFLPCPSLLALRFSWDDMKTRLTTFPRILKSAEKQRHNNNNNHIYYYSYQQQFVSSIAHVDRMFAEPSSLKESAQHAKNHPESLSLTSNVSSLIGLVAALSSGRFSTYEKPSFALWSYSTSQIDEALL